MTLVIVYIVGFIAWTVFETYRQRALAENGERPSVMMVFVCSLLWPFMILDLPDIAANMRKPVVYEDSHIAKFAPYPHNDHSNCEECVWNAESKTRILP